MARGFALFGGHGVGTQSTAELLEVVAVAVLEGAEDPGEGRESAAEDAGPGEG